MQGKRERQKEKEIEGVTREIKSQNRERRREGDETSTDRSN